ncbi:MAG: N-formylglutamate deformylase [Acidobacteriaceae bacterium]|jgi:N-formylglutamate deformylase|nr:N-formylglutamate deformylase [Acidobacteriaceae bacterium]
MEVIKTGQLGSQGEGLRASLSPIAVLHIPHSSRQVPEEERQAIRLDDAALNSELLRMTDAYTDELFPSTPVEAARLVFPVSRLVCDVERFPSDGDEPMAARGMGAVYTRTSRGEVLRAHPEAANRQTVLDHWYRPHHEMLERMVTDVTARSGVCLIIDCHSFSSIALPHEPDQTAPRPDFCIGTDSFHTPPALRDAIFAAIEDEEYSVTVDAPFAGALVPLSSCRKDNRILSVMIEVNRRLYMDEESGMKKHDFGRVSAVVGRLIVTAAEVAAQEAPTPVRGA